MKRQMALNVTSICKKLYPGQKSSSYCPPDLLSARAYERFEEGNFLFGFVYSFDNVYLGLYDDSFCHIAKPMDVFF